MIDEKGCKPEFLPPYATTTR